ncbi:MAG: ParB/RepB/Spo0J family partition protein [Alphaproteobacteria bacterium]
MAEQVKQRGLGRGLEALLGEASNAPAGQGAGKGSKGGARAADAGPAGEKAKGLRDVPIEFVHANPDQPRRSFDDADLEELAQSIRERGVLQPIIVRQRPQGRDKAEGGQFEIVAGERRWRAAQKAKLHTVPVIVKDLTDAEVLEVALVENIQRADLNALEEAAGYQLLIQKFSYTQDQLSKLIGKSRSHVANMTRLLSLPPSVQDLVRTGALSAGHARALVGADDADVLAKAIMSKGLNVRQTEALVRTESADDSAPSAADKTGKKVAFKAGPEKDADTAALERNVSNAIGLPVAIDFRGPESGGTVRITYSSLEQLDDICRRLAQT